MQMQVVRQVAGEIFNAALTIASEEDADLKMNEVRGAFPPIKEDTWQEVCPAQSFFDTTHLSPRCTPIQLALDCWDFVRQVYAIAIPVSSGSQAP